MEEPIEPPKKRILIPQNVKLYLKGDQQLQERQNRLLFWQNIFTVGLGIAQIVVAVILAFKVF